MRVARHGLGLETRLALALGLAFGSIAWSPTAHAEESPGPGPRLHQAYAEVGGRGGLYGLGLERYLAPRVHLGITAAGHRITDETTWVVSPYLGLTPASRGHHALFVDVGPRWVRKRMVSTLANWQSPAITTISAAASAGYRYENRIVLRAFAMVDVGPAGSSPWLGTSMGFAF